MENGGTYIRVLKKTRRKLGNLKLVRRESYDEIINRLIDEHLTRVGIERGIEHEHEGN